VVFIGLCVAGIGGGLIFVLGSGNHLDAIDLLLGAGLLILWGFVIFVNGVLGVTS